MKQVFHITLARRSSCVAAPPCRDWRRCRPAPSPPAPILWNLGSEQEVLNSEIGPDIQLISYIYPDCRRPSSSRRSLIMASSSITTPTMAG